MRSGFSRVGILLLPILAWYLNYVPLHLAAHEHLPGWAVQSNAEGHADPSGGSHPDDCHKDESHTPHSVNDHLAGFVSVTVPTFALDFSWELICPAIPEAEPLVVQQRVPRVGRAPPAASVA